MFKRFIVISIVVLLAYLLFLGIKIKLDSSKPKQTDKNAAAEPNVATHQVQSFTFSKYTPRGKKEFEVEGDTADVFARTVNLANVIAKTYSSDSPVTVTADGGSFDKSSGNIHLEKNVVAVTDTGARLLTESLEIDPKKKQVETEVKAEVKKDNIDIKGLGAAGDSNLKQVQFKKNVTVIVHDKSAPDDPPTIITCNGPLDIDYEDDHARFNKDVVTQDKRGTLKADVMDVYYDKKTHGVDKIVAKGNVVIINNKGNESYSEEVIYLSKEGRIIMGGDIEGLVFPDGGGGSENEIFAALDKKVGRKDQE